MSAKTEALLTQLHELVVEREVSLYREHMLTAGKAEYWRRMSALARRLSEEDREILLSIVRTVAVDSLAMTFSVLSNEHQLNEIDELRLSADDESINEDLRSEYLAKLGPV